MIIWLVTSFVNNNIDVVGRLQHNAVDYGVVKSIPHSLYLTKGNVVSSSFALSCAHRREPGCILHKAVKCEVHLLIDIYYLEVWK